MSCVSSIKIESDIKGAEQLMRIPIKRFDTHLKSYKSILTQFAFNRLVPEVQNNVQFVIADARMALSGTLRDRIVTDEKSGECPFHTEMRLPYRHIMEFRQLNNLNLFDPTICSDRWLKQNMIALAHIDYVLDNTSNIEILEHTQTHRKKKTPNQKFRACKDKCEQICQLISELPQKEYDESYQLLCDLLNKIRQNADARSTESRAETSSSVVGISATGKFYIRIFLQVHIFNSFCFVETIPSNITQNAVQASQSTAVDSSIGKLCKHILFSVNQTF